MDESLDLEQWESAVGKIVTSLARLEGELLLKYESHFSRKKYFDDSLEQRIQRIENLYEEECGMIASSKNLFSNIREHVKLRNLVAHNPVYYDSVSSKFQITNGQSKSKFVNVSELNGLSQKLYSSSLEFTVLLRIWASNKS